jgi:hypothetical protein
MSTTEIAQKTINHRASWLKQRTVLQEQVQQSLIVAIDGSFFKADPLTISLVTALIDSGLETAVILDTQQLPCKIDNLKSFKNTLIEHHQQVLNLYHQDYAELCKQRNRR